MASPARAPITSLTAALRRRRARFRATALPTFLLAVNPIRGCGPKASGGAAAACRTRPGATAFRRPRATLRNSGRLVRRPSGAVAVLCMGVPSCDALDAACSGAELGPSTGAARSEDPATSHGCHAGSEAVPALTHQDARLIGPFHGRYSVDRVLSRQSECGGVYIDSIRSSQCRATLGGAFDSRHGDWCRGTGFGTVRRGRG
jgi:hypothetical protein